MNKKYCLYDRLNDTYVMKHNKYSRLYKQDLGCSHMHLWTCKTYKYAQKMLKRCNSVWNGAFEIKEIEDDK